MRWLRRNNVLERAQVDENENYVYYIDPPYVKKGQRLYPHNFNTNDHRLLKNSLEKLQKPWILSYHHHELVQELYIEEGSLESVSLEMQWVADRAKKGTELIISNFPLIRAQRTLWTVSTDGPNGLNPLLTEEREKTLVPEGD